MNIILRLVTLAVLSLLVNVDHFSVRHDGLRGVASGFPEADCWVVLVEQFSAAVILDNLGTVLPIQRAIKIRVVESCIVEC